MEAGRKLKGLVGRRRRLDLLPDGHDLIYGGADNIKDVPGSAADNQDSVPPSTSSQTTTKDVTDTIEPSKDTSRNDWQWDDRRWDNNWNWGCQGWQE